MAGASEWVDWHILTIGCLSRNRFWGESEARAQRPARCTTTLLVSGDQRILVDPSLPPEAMATVLDERCGLRPEAIDLVYLTHFHGDHRVGLEAFGAPILMAQAEIDYWRSALPGDHRDRTRLDALRPAEGSLPDALTLLPLPGHTPGLTGLAFDAGEGRVVLAADAVMTRDFFAAKAGYFNNLDPEATRTSIERIGRSADVVIPGHDNYFIVRPVRRG
ncbi:MAG TPA: MBL fold metallo-hydrolase [Limnochordia bacterium]|nr:MBL fold metallo-hydrolase [Limnochordia bacterium]